MTIMTTSIDQLNDAVEGSSPLMAAASLLINSTHRDALWADLVQRSGLDLTVDPEYFRGIPNLTDEQKAVALLVLELAEVPTGEAVGSLLMQLSPANTHAFAEAVRVLAQ